MKDAAMFPWLWLWAPQVHFPLSGDVMQRFFQSINPDAGNAAIERRAFDEVASYGKQLGLITEVLIELAEDAELETSKESLRKLSRIREKIEQIKAEEYGSVANQLAGRVEALRRKGGPEYAQLVKRLTPLLQHQP
jgi:hypothetical protein